MTESLVSAAALERPERVKSPPWWLWPHVLSVEAPIVAVLWLTGLARIHDLRTLPGTATGLALCVWTIYVMDRTLDTLGKSAGDLDLRHAFYHRYRRLLLFLVIPAALAVLAWLALAVIPAALMWQCLSLGLLIALYLAVYAVDEASTARAWVVYAASFGALLLFNAMPLPHGFKAVISFFVLAVMTVLFVRQVEPRLGLTFPKELAGGLLFALGCTMAIRFYGVEDAILPVLLETLLLAALFTCNLTGISAKESESTEQAARARTVHPALLVLCGSVAALSLALAHFGFLPARHRELGLAVFAGLFLLAVLHALRRRLSADAYRVFADLSVAAPALGLLIFGSDG